MVTHIVAHKWHCIVIHTAVLTPVLLILLPLSFPLPLHLHLPSPPPSLSWYVPYTAEDRPSLVMFEMKLAGICLSSEVFSQLHTFYLIISNSFKRSYHRNGDYVTHTYDTPSIVNEAYWSVHMKNNNSCDGFEDTLLARVQGINHDDHTHLIIFSSSVPLVISR